MSNQQKYIEVHGVVVPALGFGTWRLSGQVCQEMVRAALDIGYRHIDTAQLYFNEDAVGQAIADSKLPREEVFLTTKIAFSKNARNDVLESVELSLKKLQTDYVDLLLIHWPSKDIPLEETLEAMTELHRQGKVRNLGVSNFPSKLLERACEISDLPIIDNQVEYHPYLSQQKVLEVCRSRRIILTAYAPTGRAKVAKDAVINEIASRHGKTPVQVTLRWLIQQELVAAIPKSAHVERVRENFDVFDFELTDEEMKTIFALNSGLRMLNPDISPEWDE